MSRPSATQGRVHPYRTAYVVFVSVCAFHQSRHVPTLLERQVGIGRIVAPCGVTAATAKSPLLRHCPKGIFMRFTWFGVAVAWLSLSALAFAGPPFLSDDPKPTDFEHYEIYLFANATFASQEKEGAAGIDFNYGATPDLQLTAVLPMAYELSTHEGSRAGVGNIELAAKFRVLHQESVGWDVAIFPRVFLKSPSDLGEQHAALLIPIWVGKDGENWSTFGGGGCELNHSGASLNFCLAGWAFTWRAAEALQIGAEVFHQGPDTKGGRASTILGAGATYDISENLHLLGYAGFGLQNTSETGRATAYVSMLFTL